MPLQGYFRVEKFNSSSSLGTECARTPLLPPCPGRERKPSQCATRGNPLSFKDWVGVRASMAAVQDPTHCGCRFRFWCIFAQILCRTRFRSAMAVESNEACKCAQCVTGPQEVGPTQNCVKHRSAHEVRTSLKVKCSDVSRNGCYLEMLSPLPMGTVVELSFTIGLAEILTEATVQTSDLGVGMGLEFTTMHAVHVRTGKQSLHLSCWPVPQLRWPSLSQSSLQLHRVTEKTWPMLADHNAPVLPSGALSCIRTNQPDNVRGNWLTRRSSPKHSGIEKTWKPCSSASLTAVAISCSSAGTAKEKGSSGGPE
jgi:hypothetical protein